MSLPVSVSLTRQQVLWQRGQGVIGWLYIMRSHIQTITAWETPSRIRRLEKMDPDMISR